MAVMVTHFCMGATAFAFAVAGAHAAFSGMRASAGFLMVVALLQAIGAAMWFYR